MTMPQSNVLWVPDEWQNIYARYAEHSAWYSGDPNQLLNIYLGNGYIPTANGRFWAEQQKNEMESVVHVPLASDIATFSADMLFSEMPDIQIVEAHESKNSRATQAQERLDTIIEDSGLINRLLEAGETTAALGGCYLKPVWDSELADFPILTIAQPDNALPEFKFGILQAVTFHKVIERDGSAVYRLLERHTKGHIENALYIGTDSRIGSRVPLSYRTDTTEIPDEINTGIDDLLVRYVPNKMPNKLFRGSSMGMSDYAGSETLLSALDSTMSSWIRDIELGRGRLIVPEMFLDKPNATSDPRFDANKEIFTTLEMDPMTSEKAPITLSQFNIRMAEHRDTALELIMRIVSNAGYSTQSFGLNLDGGISTQSHEIRERKTLITKQKKSRFFKSALQDILHMMLQIDNIHLGNGTPTEFEPVVAFSDTLQHDIGAIAGTLDTLNRAESASIKTRVEILHPDWTAEQVEQEVQDIMKEKGISAVDPMSIGGKSYEL